MTFEEWVKAEDEREGKEPHRHTVKAVWIVCGPDGVGVSGTFDNELDAENVADMLDEAYNQGRRDAWPGPRGE